MSFWQRLRAKPAALWAAAAVPLVAVIGVVGWSLASGAPTPSPSTAATASPTAEPTATASPTPVPTPTPSPTPTPTPTPTPQPQGLDDGRLTLLVLGSDNDAARQIRRGGDFLTDAITVVSVTEDGREIAMFSLPRDTADVPLPDGSLWTGKINSLAYYRGVEATRGAMSLLLGVPIDHYLMVDMDDFRMVVNAVNGVTVRVPYALSDKRCYIGPGRQRMDGGTALCYVRHREDDSDYARAGRHQQVLLALMRKLAGGDVRIGALVRSLASVQTDIRMSDLAAYADLLRRAARRADVERVVLGPPTYTTFVGIAGPRGWISVPNIPVIQSTVAAMLR
jgi:LCP family protein required for cell wall assembly